MYLNVYQPKLQTEKQAACFLRFHRQQPVASSSLMGVMTHAFLEQVDGFVERHRLSSFARVNARTMSLPSIGHAGTGRKACCFSARPKRRSPSFGPRSVWTRQDPLVLALFSTLLVFRLLPRGFSNRELRDHWAPLIGKTPQSITPGQMKYHLRRLRLHGLIERVPKSHRYPVTDGGWRTILFCTRFYNRVLRPGLSEVVPKEAETDTRLRRCFDQLDEAIKRWLTQQRLAA